MTDKLEKSKHVGQTKHIPKDAQVIMSIMRDMEISEYEPRVINQLLEFTYRYVACILEDAKTYANHAKKKLIDLDDVKLALRVQLEQAFTLPPPRELLTDIARTKNSVQLPLIKLHNGIRLPPDRFCLSSCNLKVKLPQFTKKNMKVMSPYTNNIGDRGMKLPSKSNVGLMKRNIGNVPVVARTQTVTLTKPIGKFTIPPPKTILKPKINITNQSGSEISTLTNTNAMATDDTGMQINTLKRKRSDDDYDVSL